MRTERKDYQGRDDNTKCVSERRRMAKGQTETRMMNVRETRKVEAMGMKFVRSMFCHEPESRSRCLGHSSPCNHSRRTPEMNGYLGTRPSPQNQSCECQLHARELDAVGSALAVCYNKRYKACRTPNRIKADQSLNPVKGNEFCLHTSWKEVAKVGNSSCRGQAQIRTRHSVPLHSQSRRSMMLSSVRSASHCAAVATLAGAAVSAPLRVPEERTVAHNENIRTILTEKCLFENQFVTSVVTNPCGTARKAIGR
uniref:Uncharacterized protein n=1 Tax=Timema poppense TaxID=170557 RepID=A0A7R9DCM5_TIMPO|nr:unnamed protein product [Timema poppensis]